MGKVRELAERAWNGDVGGNEVHPGRALVALEVYDDRLAYMSAFSNAVVIDTE